jgi:hypothetical protein
MTLKDILETDYGIDFDSLTFKMRDKNPDYATDPKDIKESLATDEIIVDGSFITDFDLYGDCPGGYLELYWGDDLANAAEGACARLG